MKSFVPIFVVVALISWSTTVAAEVRGVTFNVGNMTCALCHVTVRKSAEAIPGVKKVTVSTETGTATVLFDDAATNSTAIAEAITNAGYPASPIRQ